MAVCCTCTILFVHTCSYIAAHSESLAMSVIVSNGVQQLANALAAEQEDHIQVFNIHFFNSYKYMIYYTIQVP